MRQLRESLLPGMIYRSLLFFFAFLFCPLKHSRCINAGRLTSAPGSFFLHLTPFGSGPSLEVPPPVVFFLINFALSTCLIFHSSRRSCSVHGLVPAFFLNSFRRFAWLRRETHVFSTKEFGPVTFLEPYSSAAPMLRERLASVVQRLFFNAFLQTP